MNAVHPHPIHPRPIRRSHGDGSWTPGDFAEFGGGSVLEEDVLVFRPGSIHLGADVYVGHQAVLKGYHQSRMRIGDGTWIGEQAYLNSAGGLTIGRDVGIGIGVRIITSSHAEQGRALPILHARLQMSQVSIGDGCDLGVSCVVLPGVSIGVGVQVGAGAVVTADLPDFAVAAGVPARVLRMRPEAEQPEDDL